MANEKYVMMSDNPTGTGSFSLNRKADTTIGTTSFAEGNSTTASGSSSHAEGGYTTASGMMSHASGNGTTASGDFSTATGFATQATGLHSFTGGLNSIASQQCSFAYGNNVTSSYANKAVFGIYNDDKSDTLFEVGIGTSSADKKNAFEVVNDGTIRTLNGIFSKLSDNYSILDGNADEGVGASNFALYTAYTELLTKIESGGSGGQANVQSDWAETNTESDSYIKNKPTNLLYNSDSNLAVVDTTGDDTKNDVTTFTSEDSTTAESWTDVEVLSSGEKHSSLWKKVSIMFKNIRYLKNFLGNNDISAIGDGTVTGAVNTLNDKLSHVGMIIHTTTLDTEEKVKAIYGGTSWSKIEGRFLLGQSSSYAINSTGGEATHKLTVNEMPSHNHAGKISAKGAYLAFYNDGTAGDRGTASYNSTGDTFSLTSNGGNKAHNNMPPYKTVYIWERTA